MYFIILYIYTRIYLYTQYDEVEYVGGEGVPEIYIYILYITHICTTSESI